MAKSPEIKVVLIILISLLICILAPFIGGTTLNFSELLLSDSVTHKIFWSMRVPRGIFAFLAGAGLAVAGVVFQAIFCNFLASPFTLGVASGAAFGSALFYNLGLSFAFLGIGGSSWFGMAGALVTIAPVYLMTRSARRISSTEILLAGVVLSLFFSSLIVFVQYISDFTGILRITRWLMGGFEVVGYEPVLALLPFVLIGAITTAYFAFELNLFSVGEELAISRGLDATKVKALLFLVISLMVGAVVSFCGPISSVGIMAPHIARMLVGFDHRKLVAAAFFGGGAFVVLCDTLARTIIAPFEIPVGVVTSLLEGPFFLWLLYKRRWARA